VEQFQQPVKKKRSKKNKKNKEKEFDDGTAFWSEPSNYTNEDLDDKDEQQSRSSLYSNQMSKNRQQLKRAAKNNRTSKHLEKYSPPPTTGEEQLIKDIVTKVKEELASKENEELSNFLQSDGKVNIEFHNQA